MGSVVDRGVEDQAVEDQVLEGRAVGVPKRDGRGKQGPPEEL